MNKEHKIHLVADEQELAEAAFSAELSDDGAQIDRILRLVAEEETADIDFDRIRSAAIESAKARKAKSQRLRRAAGYAMCACAAFLIGFSVLTSLGKIRLNGNKKIALGNLSYGQADNGPISGDSGIKLNFDYMESSTSLMESYELIIADPGYGGGSVSDSVEELFPDNLPKTMDVYTIDTYYKHISAEGCDDSGNRIAYDCIVTKAPEEYEVGDACTAVDGDDILYVYKLTEEECLAVRFTGFDRESADKMFGPLASKVLSIVQPTEETSDPER
ncbi:MAG: hypothetical protein IKS90_01110 [Clostridia bacterium]|nr:hypothetical protein [Clostridia bacterium]